MSEHAGLEQPLSRTFRPGVPESDIARRAFELYSDRAREDGHDVDGCGLAAEGGMLSQLS